MRPPRLPARASRHPPEFVAAPAVGLPLPQRRRNHVRGTCRAGTGRRSRSTPATAGKRGRPKIFSTVFTRALCVTVTELAYPDLICGTDRQEGDQRAAALRLVPDEEDDAIVGVRELDDGRQVAGQPAVAGGDHVRARAARSAVHVVAQVRRDEVVLRDGALAQRRGERAGRVGAVVSHANAGAGRRGAPHDVLEEHERIVLGRVEPGRRDRAGAGRRIQPLLETQPAHRGAGRHHLRHQMGGAGGAVASVGIAVAGERRVAEGVRAGLHPDVVRLAGDGVGQRVRERHGVRVLAR